MTKRKTYTTTKNQIKLVQYEEISETLRWNLTEGGYEFLTGNTWLKLPFLSRTSLRLWLEDMEANPDRRSPFDKYTAEELASMT